MKNSNLVKEVKISLFAGDMMLCIENPKDSTQKLLELINEFNKLARYTIYIQESVAVLHSNSEISEKVMAMD